MSYKWRHKVKHGIAIERIYAAFKADEGKAFKAEYRYRVKVEGEGLRTGLSMLGGEAAA